VIRLGREPISSFNFEAGEILNIDKPARMTSFGVIERIRKWTQCRKIGHAGTLDPLATGVLLVCTGLATKRVSELVDLEKEYEGIVELGKITETDDAEGRILKQNRVPRFSTDELMTVLTRFTGEIKQVPPMYSAIKKNGRRLYKLARRGEVIPRDARNVRVYEMTLLEWQSPCLRVRVRCSKGTYIRALARDIGEQLGTGGYLKTLRRTRVGPYRVEEGYSVDMLRELLLAEHESI
jgi:tRNA pseudouridine55 synthase